MIAFLKNLFCRNTDKIDELRSELLELQRQRDEWIRKHNRLVDKTAGLERVIENLSSAQEYERSVSGAISKEIYEAKILKTLGNTLITAQDTPQSTGFKMGIQHALRLVEQEVVV